MNLTPFGRCQMILLFLALAPVFTVTPANLDAILTPNDYPTWAVEREESAAAVVDVLVEPSGRVSRCVLQQTIGSKNLGREICSIAMKRRVQPARDAQGTETYGVARTLLRMFLDETQEGEAVRKTVRAPDVVLAVTKLPGGEKMAEAEVLISVDETGHATSCGPRSAGDRQQVVEAICSARDQLGVGRVANAQGEAIRYVTTKKVELRVGDAAVVRN
jgi:hypothetical protein